MSAFPLSFYTFQENINTLRQTTEREPFCPSREFCGSKVFRKPVAPVAYKNKLTVNRRRYLAGVLWPLMYRCALFPSGSDVSVSYMQSGLRRSEKYYLTNFQFSNELNHLISDNWHSEIIFILVPFLFNCQGYREDFFFRCTPLFKFQGYREDFLLRCTLLFKLQRVQGRLFVPLYPSFQTPRVQGRLFVPLYPSFQTPKGTGKTFSFSVPFFLNFTGTEKTFYPLYPSFQMPRAQENIFIFCAHKSIPTKNSQPSAWSIEKYLLH